MSNPSQLVQFAFAAGIDQSQQPEVLDPTTGFTFLQNVRQERRGGVEKRLGTNVLPVVRDDGSNRSAGVRMCSFNRTTCVLDGSLDAFSEELGRNIHMNRVPDVGVSTRTLAGTLPGTVGSNVLTGNIDFARCGSYLCVLRSRQRDTVKELVAYLTTVDGVDVRADTIASIPFGVTTLTASMGTYGTILLVLVPAPAAATVAAFYLDTANAATIALGWQSLGNVVTDKIAAGASATLISTQSLDASVAFVYVNTSSATHQITLAKITSSGVTATSLVNTNSVTPKSIVVEGSDSDTLWVAHNEGIIVWLEGRSPSSIGTALATEIDLIACNADPAACSISITSDATSPGTGRALVFDGSNDQSIIQPFATVAGAATPIGSPVAIRCTRLVARPFQMNGRYYGLFRGGEFPGVFAQLGTSALCDWTDTIDADTPWVRPIAVAFPSLMIPDSADMHYAISGATVTLAATVQRSALGSGSSIELLTYDYNATSRWRPAMHNRALFLSGGVLSYFDGRRVAECDFVHSPAAPKFGSTSAGAPGLTGTFRYVATFEEIDDLGNWCTSGVSTRSVAALLAGENIDITMEPLAITSRYERGGLARVRTLLWRSTETGGNPYKLVTSFDHDPTTQITFTDDGLTLDGRLLYGTGNLPGTAGAAQDRRISPFANDVVSFNGMLVTCSGNTLWYSGQTVDGEGTWHSPIFQVPCGSEGNIVAIAVEDSTLYAWTASSIYAFSGDAPNDAGTQGGLGAPRRLAVDVGCISPESVVVTSLGVFFQSDRGIELLTRAQAVELIGAPVQSTVASYPVMTSAVLDTRHGLVRFAMRDPEVGGLGGVTIIYDLQNRVWQSIDVYPSGESSTSAGLIYYNDAWRYAWLGDDGVVHYERDTDDPAAHLDGSAWVTMRGDTASVKMSGIQGQQYMNRVLLLAKQNGAADLSMALAYDYSDSWKTPIIRTDTTIATLSSSLGRVQLQHLTDEDAEGQAARLLIEDAPPTSGNVGNGKGHTWIAVTFDGTPRDGAVQVSEEAA